jgi:hypothetical protein
MTTVRLRVPNVGRSGPSIQRSQGPTAEPISRRSRASHVAGDHAGASRLRVVTRMMGGS